MFSEPALRGRLRQVRIVSRNRNKQGLKLLLQSTMLVIAGAGLDWRNAVETAFWKPGTLMAVLRASAQYLMTDCIDVQTFCLGTLFIHKASHGFCIFSMLVWMYSYKTFAA